VGSEKISAIALIKSLDSPGLDVERVVKTGLKSAGAGVPEESLGSGREKP
jgi:hypothetical protein